MPQTLAVGMLLKSTVYCGAGLQGAQNSRYWRVTAVSGIPMTDLDAANRLSVLLQPLYVAILSAAANYRGLKVQIFKPLAYDPVSVIAPATGTVTGDILPTEISLVAHFKSGLAGRKHRNRIYYPFPGESSNDANGNPTAGYITNCGVLSAQYASNVTVTVGANTATLVPIVWPGLLTETGETVQSNTLATLWSSLDTRSARSSQNPDPFT